MRLKNFYSPDEEKGIRTYHLKTPPRDPNKREYDLFNWNGVSFAPYNCYELTHITDRALFKSHVDMIVACEDNKDTAYFSSIIDSLAADIHCYCIQVNASQYGDSKIT